MARWHTSEVPSHSFAIEILGIPYACVDADSALAEAERLYEEEAPAWIAIENVHGVNIAVSDPAHKDVLRRANLRLNDGKGVMLGARIQGRRFPVDLNGNFFSPLLLRRAAERGWPVFFLGAAPGVAQRAGDRLTESIPGLRIVGVRDGFFKRDQEEEVVEAIRATEPGLLMVGMGNPLQEQWLDRNIAATGARLGVTVGAFFDFQAGEMPRAPAWMNSAGLEWVYRLTKEPRRLWRRYLIGNPLFLWRVARDRLAKRSTTQEAHA